MGADGLGQGTEGRRWDGHVVDELRRPAHLVLGLLDHVEQAAGIGGVESPAGKAQAGPYFVPWTLRRLRAEFLEALPHPLLEVLVGDVAAAVPDQSPVGREQSGDGQLKEGRQDKAVSQVPCRSIQDEDRRVGGEGAGAV